MLRLSGKSLLYLSLTGVILYMLSPLEIFDFSIRKIAYVLIWFTLFAIFFNSFPRQNTFDKIVMLLLGTVVYIILTFIALLFTCSWTNHGIMYQNKGNASVKIICKTYDCYGTAEGCRLFKQQEILPHVCWVTKFDDNEVDTSIWERTR